MSITFAHFLDRHEVSDANRHLIILDLEHIITLQKSIEEKLEEVKMQATGNRAKRCKLCEEKREGEAAALVKECCDTIHRCDGQQNIEC